MHRSVALLLILGVGTFLLSCHKHSYSIAGKWQVISDSVSIGGSSLIPEIHTNYKGTSNDYYEFTTTGNLYISENSKKDSGAYRLEENNMLHCTFYYLNSIRVSAGGDEYYLVSGLSDHHLTLSQPAFFTPGGQQVTITGRSNCPGRPMPLSDQCPLPNVTAVGD